MPNKNTVKVFVSDSYYHVYNRGWNLQSIFKDQEDRIYFETLLARHLSIKPKNDAKGREYKHLRPTIQLIAYCLMNNHFHLLVYQSDEFALTKLMRSILVAYTMYFNKKYHQRGSLFESVYKAVRISSDAQLMHITRYIHLNHRKFRTWKYSSYQDYLTKSRSWLNTKPILELFQSSEAYRIFIDDYEALQRERDNMKHELANE